MIANPQINLMSVEEYLEWEPLQEIRYEYFAGELVAMTGGTIPHNDIALNLYRALYPHVRSKECRINVADVKVQLASGIYFYPDLVVSCDQRDKDAIKLIQHPKLIIEVLSPGTEAYDRGKKFRQYRSMPSLEEYVLIDSTQVSVECFRRGEGKVWLFTPYTAGETVTLESLGFSGAIDQIYEDVQLQPAEVESLEEREN
ncbi:MAG TPA: Uma2 family endonuclease [Allocoleopsis sp.]